MNRNSLLLLFACLSIFAQAQTTIRGKVVDVKKQPLVGANITLKDTYDGATSDVDGNFEFKTDETGEQILKAQFISYDTDSLKVTLVKGAALELNFMLKESFNELKVVTITAGAFEASDNKRATVLKPLDIVTTASANGDTYGALLTLPGNQVASGDQEGLFVRGGSGSEAQTFIDGTLVRNPFFSSTPDVAQRGRFSPFLFKGTVFSSGGYSAQYGQGMSSALILETQDFPTRSATSLGLSIVGLSVGTYQIAKNERSAYGGSFDYTNLSPYFWLNPQRRDFDRVPTFAGGSMYARWKTGKMGIIKLYSYYNGSDLSSKFLNADSMPTNFELKNGNFYSNLSYADALSETWQIKAALSVSTDRADINSNFPSSNFNGKFVVDNNFAQAKITLSHILGRLNRIRFGSEYQHGFDRFKSETAQVPSGDLSDNFSSVFVESDLYLSTKFVAQLGARYEYSSFLAKGNLAPRLSLAYKLTDISQLSFAYGHFYQKGDSLLRWQYYRNGYNTDFQRATHYIFQYQRVKDGITFRTELFRKDYDKLTTTGYGQGIPSVGNLGTGYAQGAELFFRDQKTFNGVDYWISYSYLDTKRKYLYYPIEAQPTYAANHNATFRFYKFFVKQNMGVGCVYNFATGRPYLNPNETNEQFLSGRTPTYHNFSVNLNYLTTIKKAFTVVVLSVTNVFGNEQVFGYRYSDDGKSREAVTPQAVRTVFLGMFMSWGQDRRNDVIKNQ